MKKYLLIGGAVALCLVGVMFVAQADDAVRYDHNGNPYVHKGHGAFFGSLAKIGTGSNREYINEGPRRYEGRDEEYEGRYNRENLKYRR